MVQSISLTAEERENKSKGYLKELRQQGEIPAILYGKQVGNQLIRVNSKEFRELLLKGGKNALIDLKIKGNNHKVMIKDINMETIKREVVHVDFQQVSLKSKIHAKAAVRLIGEAEGVVNGGTLQLGVREVEIECLPTDIPEYLNLDIANLNIGESKYVKDIELVEGVTILSDPDTVVITIVQPRLATEDEGETGEEDKEVEVKETEDQVQTKETEVK